MKTLLLSALLITSTFANTNNLSNCSEYRLGKSKTYIYTCDKMKIKVGYAQDGQYDINEFEVLEKNSCNEINELIKQLILEQSNKETVSEIVSK